MNKEELADFLKNKYDGVSEWVQIAQAKIEKMSKQELIKFSEENKPTFEETYGSIEKMDLNLHTTDDYGFEGQVIMKDGKKVFHRWVDDDIPEWKLDIELEKKDSIQLENLWQGQSQIISSALYKAWDKNTTKEESERMMTLAKDAQWKQSKIQDEITRKAK